MKLILLTSPKFFVEEDKILTSLFEEGLDVLHIRKPDSEPVYCERLLHLLPSQYRSKIVVHDHFYLKDEFNLMGIHLSRRNPEKPSGYTGAITRTCYSIDELRQYEGQQCPYICLRNIFDSTTPTPCKASFTQDELLTYTRQGIINKKVIAEGGITLDNIKQAKELGFGGVAIQEDLWCRFDIHSQIDFRELISHFRKIRKAVD